MIYCQECGAANDLGNPTCRLCGRGLHHRRGALHCANCQELLGVGASFCANCGATAGDVALSAIAAGGPPPNATAVAALFSAPAADDRVGDDSPAVDAFNIGAGLELPEWLKRAAAETPPSSAAPPPSVRHVPFSPAPGEARDADLAARLASTHSAPAMVAEPPLPPIPDGGLASTMPTWLTSGFGADDALVPPRATEYTRPSSLIPSRSLLDDPTDTASFITENDLPEWLRQLATSEAAEAVENERAAHEAAVADSLTVAAAALAATGEPEPFTLPTLAETQPGDDFAASGRWLARSGDPGAAESGRRSAFANLVEEHDAEQDAIAVAAAPILSRSSAEPLARSAPTAPPALASSGRTRAATDAKRWIVIGALVLLIAVLLAYLISTGSLG